MFTQHIYLYIFNSRNEKKNTILSKQTGQVGNSVWPGMGKQASYMGKKKIQN